MIRTLTSVLWLIAALALGFEAAAQPCDMRAEMSAEMPCHNDVDMPASEHDQAPEHDKTACCCAALLGNGVTVAPISIAQPAHSLMLWSIPIPDNAHSVVYQHEPPPPRA